MSNAKLSSWPVISILSLRRTNVRKQSLWACALIILLLTLLLSACAPPPPHNQLNLCGIFYKYPRWYWYAKQTRKRWGVPISVQMAIMHQESHFRADALPPRKKLLGFIPWSRQSTAEGYAQAVNHTWEQYLLATHHARANRTSFKSASDFIGWFAYRAHKRVGIPRDNAYELYLAYHEGNIGYQQKTYRRKPWLIRIAHSVQRRADRYRQQLFSCEASIPKHHWWQF